MTSRRQEAGAASRAETRQRLLRAAEEEFAERGYRAATVARIAARAGVTVQTLYLAWGSKRALLRAHLDAALSGNPDTRYADELPRLLSQTFDRAGADSRADGRAGADDVAGPGADGGAGPGADDGVDGRDMIRRVARLYRGIAERAALGWRLYRDAADSDAAIAADWRALQHMRRETFAEIVHRLPAPALRSDLTPDAAVDTAWAIASPETFDLLVRTAGYTLDQYEHWVAATLASALLAEAAH